jgi:hypothetical protein
MHVQGIKEHWNNAIEKIIRVEPQLINAVRPHFSFEFVALSTGMWESGPGENGRQLRCLVAATRPRLSRDYLRRPKLVEIVSDQRFLAHGRKRFGV